VQQLHLHNLTEAVSPATATKTVKRLKVIKPKYLDATLGLVQGQKGQKIAQTPLNQPSRKQELCALGD
jgi:hypothetical protein